MNRKIALVALLLLATVGALSVMRGWNGRSMPTAAATSQSALESGSINDESSRGNDEEGKPSSDLVKIPPKYRFGSQATVSMAENDQSLLARYSAEDQAIIRAFYSGFGNTGFSGMYMFDNAFSFKNRRQFEWLVANGYPLPDDILMAAKIPPSELLSLAKKGNFKAKAMLLAREYQATATSSAALDSAQMEKYKELSAFQADVLSDGSPFAGYVWAAEHIKKPVSDGRAGVLAGYMFAETLGDDRAGLFAGEYAKKNPGMNPAEALASYKAMLGIASRNPQLANTITLMKRRKFESI